MEDSSQGFICRDNNLKIKERENDRGCFIGSSPELRINRLFQLRRPHRVDLRSFTKPTDINWESVTPLRWPFNWEEVGSCAAPSDGHASPSNGVSGRGLGSSMLLPASLSPHRRIMSQLMNREDPGAGRESPSNFSRQWKSKTRRESNTETNTCKSK